MITNWIKAFFSRAVKVFNAIFKVAFPIATKMAVGILLEKYPVLSRVKELELLNIPGSQKSDLLYNEVKEWVDKQDIEVLGQPITGNDIALAIKMAVSAIRNENAIQ